VGVKVLLGRGVGVGVKRLESEARPQPVDSRQKRRLNHKMSLGSNVIL
jgi:hypothetical protein